MQPLPSFKLLSTLSENSNKTVVYKAFDSKRSCEVAVKFNPTTNASKSFYSEVTILKLLNHPNILKLWEWHLPSGTDSRFWIVFPFYPLGDLFQYLILHGPQPESVAKIVLSQLASAIDYLHQMGIVHRDIKLENVLIERMHPSLGIVEKIILADFGLAKMVHDEQTHTPCGTFQYCAPEIITDSNYCKKVDSWALGCLIYTFICGYPPFYDDAFGSVADKIRTGAFEFAWPQWQHISMNLQDLISRLLETNAVKRWNARQVLEWLADPHLSDLSVPAQKPQKPATPFHPRPQSLWSPLPDILKTPALHPANPPLDYFVPHKNESIGTLPDNSAEKRVQDVSALNASDTLFDPIPSSSDTVTLNMNESVLFRKRQLNKRM